MLFSGRELLGELLPAEGLAQNPQRDRDGNKEQTKTGWATPAEPRTPRAPVFEAAFVIPVVLSFVVFRTFALLWHSLTLLLNEGLSSRGVDDVRVAQAYPFTYGGLLPAMVFAE